jgi:hypothetical protein
MEQYWEHGWYYLAAGQSMDIVISFGDLPQGLQFIAAEPRGITVARMDIVSHGIHTEPRFARLSSAGSMISSSRRLRRSVSPS